jgi:hypothetical protein
MTKSLAPTNNPAGRLNLLLSKLSSGDLHQPAFEVICTALNIEPRDRITAYKVWTNILLLVTETEDAIQVLPSPKQLIYSRSLTELRQYLSISNWDMQWMSVGGPLCTPECSLLSSIELCAWDLADPDEIEPEKLAEIRKSIEDLLMNISSSEISPEIRIFLIEKLREIQRAIDDYSFYGSSGLQKTLELVLGGAHFQDQSVQDQTNPTVRKFWEVVKNLSTLLSLATNIEKITPAIHTVLTSEHQNFLP